MISTRLLRPRTTGKLLGQAVRCASTLDSNPNIYVFPSPTSPSVHILTLLPTSPPNSSLAIGTTSKLPPTPDSLRENPKFLSILDSVLSAHAHKDPGLVAQAAVFASTSGSALGSGGVFFPTQNKRGLKGKGGAGSMAGDGAGGASSQGGAGGGGRGGWVHLSDSRAPPDYGRIAWPEDIFGSLEVDGQGAIVGENGNWQRSGSYRVITRDGILGLSDFLREKLVQRLREEESKD
ncbi:hypothetical protein BP6252_03118 [Coleophoma cylindrospora]|uniref:Uncharacterized protein n=1 Tax=Coleophoma cylindrospora TaxID=1849047 RepID=A0A3D8S6W0_9HELO|nr:hypothetical protein BP6252_03118 [Coleophoma cylindrospora]